MILLSNSLIASIINPIILLYSIFNILLLSILITSGKTLWTSCAINPVSSLSKIISVLLKVYPVNFFILSKEFSITFKSVLTRLSEIERTPLVASIYSST